MSTGPACTTTRPPAQRHDPDARKVYVLESDPSEFLAGAIPVHFDPDDPRRYPVDTTSLPSPGNATDPEEPA